MKEVKFLGHVVSQGGIFVDPGKVQAVQNWARLTMVMEVRSFLSLAGYYLRFIKGFSQLALPLTEMIRKNTAFVWITECEKCFQELKEKLTTTPMLVLPHPNRAFEV